MQCGVNRSGCWKVTFSEIVLLDACVHLRSEHRRVSSVIQAYQLAVTRVVLQHRQSLEQTPHRHGLVRGRPLGVGATPSVVSVCRLQAVTRVTLLHQGSHRLVAVSVCQKLVQCKTSDRQDSQPSVYCVILTVAVTMSLSQRQ